MTQGEAPCGFRECVRECIVQYMISLPSTRKRCSCGVLLKR